MANPTRLRLLGVISQLRRIFPRMRFGQLLCNLASLVDTATEAVWTVDDESLLAEAEEFLDSQVRRLGLSGRSLSEQDLERIAREYAAFDDQNEPGTSLDALFAECLDRFADRRFGELVAVLVAHHARPKSSGDWAASIWEIRDDDLESVAREVMISGAGLPDLTTLTRSFGSDPNLKLGLDPSDRILPTQPLRSHSNSG